MAQWRLDIDVTETLASGSWTGIQRVVRKLTQELAAIAVDHQVVVRPVAAVNGRFHAITPRAVARLGEEVLEGARVEGSTSRLFSLIGSLLQLSPRLFVVVRDRFHGRRYASVLGALVDPVPLRFDADDTVFLLDAYWNGGTAAAAAKRARSQGARIVTMIYDLIPITHPEMMTKINATSFPPWLLRALRLSDGAISISRDCAAQLRQFLGKRLPSLPIVAVHLGNDVAATPAAARDAAAPPSYVMVGTIEPRKGHGVALDAFERLWAQGDPSTLTFVGRLGWADAALIDRCRDHPENGRRLRLVHDADDARLMMLVGTADAVIVASRIEGFGLPIVEALAADVPVIASDIAVFREIGGDAILYFDWSDPASLLKAIDALRSDPERYRQLARDFRWPSWRDAAQRTLATLASLTGRPAPHPDRTG